MTVAVCGPLPVGPYTTCSYPLWEEAIGTRGTVREVTTLVGIGDRVVLGKLVVVHVVEVEVSVLVLVDSGLAVDGMRTASEQSTGNRSVHGTEPPRTHI